MDDFVVNVRQIGQYPRLAAAGADDLVLVQQGGLGGPYANVDAATLVSTALMGGGELNMTGANGIVWPGASFIFGGSAFYFSHEVVAPLLNVQSALIGGDIAATQGWVAEQLRSVNIRIDNTVWAFNGRTGTVFLNQADINSALCLDPCDVVASQSWVNAALCKAIPEFYYSTPLVYTWNGRVGDVFLTLDDTDAAFFAQPGRYPTAPTAALGDASSKIATTMFVDEGLDALYQNIQQDLQESIDLSGYAKLNSPAFTGIPTAPTANPGNNTGQIATTAFVQAAVTASTTGVSSFNTRTGAVVLTLADVTGVGGAPLASPALTGTPTAPTAAPTTNNTQLATTAFVQAAVSTVTAGVSSFNGRTGAITLITGDITGAGGAPIAGPAFTGTVTAPTPAPASNDTTVATTAFVHAAIAALPTAVTSFNSRTGAITLQGNDVSAAGGALIASPAFTGTPTAPTPVVGDSSTKLATTAFVQAAISSQVAGVTSFNGRNGAVTLVTADITGAGGAPIASPNLTGTPTAPTAAQATNDTTIASTAFVHAAIAAMPVQVTSFNSRTGAVSLVAGDISAAGGALIASPAFTGTPTAPTPAPGNSSTQLATTAFITNLLATGSVSSFNGRTGAVTLAAGDITGAGGALLASPTFTGTPNAPTATAGTSNTQIATTAFVQAAVAAAGVTSFNTRTGAIVFSVADLTSVNGAMLSQGTAPPASPSAQNLWWDTNGGNMYVWFGGAWVAAMA